MNEFAVWGIPPGKKDEDLLVTKIPGTDRPLSTREQAETVVTLLKKKGCTKMRIQHLDGAVPDFTKAVKPLRQKIREFVQENTERTKAGLYMQDSENAIYYGPYADKRKMQVDAAMLRAKFLYLNGVSPMIDDLTYANGVSTGYYEEGEISSIMADPKGNGFYHKVVLRSPSSSDIPKKVKLGKQSPPITKAEMKNLLRL